MKKLCKCFITIGLFFFFSLLLPLPFKASATTVAIEKENDYRLNLDSIPLVKGKSHILKVYNLDENAKVTYKSDHEEIASVSGTGEITAISVGSTVITATIKFGITRTDLECEVTVGLPAFSVKLTKSSIFLGLDKTDFMNVILKPSNTVEDARFSSFDSSIVSVSTGGRITTKKYGLTYVFAGIDATNADGSRKFSRCTIIVLHSEDITTLETYISKTPELDYVAEEDLNKAYFEFFNTKYEATSSTSFKSSLSSYLEEKLKLEDKRKLRDADLARLQLNSTETNSAN